MGRLLEAGRRMTKALDPKAIAMIASEEAAVLTAASFTGAIEVTPDGLRLAHQTRADAFDERRLGEGALGRVLETGQPIRAVSQDEPALTSLPASLLAVPVISAGRVGGVLVAVRPDDMPFTAEEQDDLLRLAPMVGSAWEAASVHDGVAEQAMRDGLTGLANRRRLDRDLPDALAGGDRTIGIVMIDVDHFKTYNDTHGHAAGDEALRSVAEILSVNVRDGDVVYRYGGEEFCVLLPDTTDEEACAVAERLRAAVEAAPFAGEERQPGGKVTISVGLALTEGGDPDAALRSADGALYEAKHGGRNRVVVVLGPDGPGLLLS
jgi:diguanylate cyclase (GGDEF)-like protein